MISMLRAGILGTLLSLAPALALAGEHKLPAGKPVVSITLPDNWEVSADTHSVSATPKEGDVYVAAMLVSMGEFTRAMKFWEDSLADLKITRDETSKTVQKFKFEGGDSISTAWKAKDETGPIRLVQTILKLSENHLLFVTKWGPEAAHKKYAGEILEIQRSVTKLK